MRQRDEAVAHYALEGLASTVMAAEYRLALPDEQLLVEELERTRRALELRGLADHPVRTSAIEAQKPPRKAKGKGKKG